MKHILNNLSEEEKNRIREQHTGGKKIVIENFNKLVNTKLGDTKPFLTEENVDLGNPDFPELGYTHTIDDAKKNSGILKSKLQYCKSISTNELCVSTGYHDSKGSLIGKWQSLNKVLHKNGYEQKKGPSYKDPVNLDLNSTWHTSGEGPFMITAIFTNL